MIYKDTKLFYVHVHAITECANIVNTILNSKKPILVKVNGMVQFGCITNDMRVKLLINQPYFNN